MSIKNSTLKILQLHYSFSIFKLVFHGTAVSGFSEIHSSLSKKFCGDGDENHQKTFALGPGRALMDRPPQCYIHLRWHFLA